MSATVPAEDLYLRGGEILVLSREIRLLDSAEAALREELDDLAARVVSLRGGSIPPGLSSRLSIVSAEITRVVVDRGALVRRLAAID